MEITQEFLIKNSHLINIDSRNINKGDIFVAIVGDKFNGHEFCKDALKKRALFCVVSEPIDIRIDKLHFVKDTKKFLQQLAHDKLNNSKAKVVAITGSCGKTSVKEITAFLLSKHFNTYFTQKNNNNELGLPLTILKMPFNTEYLVLEMGARHKGDIKFLCEIAKPYISLVNNIGTAHIEEFGGMDNTSVAKGEIYDATRLDGTIVINDDDAYAKFYQDKYKNRQFKTFGKSEYCNFVLSNINSNNLKSTFNINDQNFTLNLQGKHNVYNALAAIAICCTAGISLSDLSKYLIEFEKVAGRLETFRTNCGALIIDDSYNATYNSVIAAIDVMCLNPGEKILVLGDMLELGDYSLELHLKVAEYSLEKGINKILTYGKLSKVISDKYPDKSFSFNSHNDIFEFLDPVLSKNHVVLIKGSNSMQMNQVALLLKNK